MTELGQVIAKLVDEFSTLSSISNSTSLSFCWPEKIDPIDWLETQSLYPKFYWQARDGEEEVIAIGQIKTFDCPVSAESCLQKKQRVWGGYGFYHQKNALANSPQSFFFLPQFELVRRGADWSLTFHFGDNLFKAQAALSALSYTDVRQFAQSCRIVSLKQTPSYENWSQMVNDALDCIEHSFLQKVVLARKTTVHLEQPIYATQLLKVSRQINPQNFHFLFAINKEQTFIGSTPERLFLREDNSILTEALAGTVGRGCNEQDDSLLANWLLNDDKNIYENKLVVDDILQRLKIVCKKISIEQKPHLVCLRQVQHLKRNISAILTQNSSSAHLLNALHPTAAVAGFPRQNAIDFIREHEPFQRGWYSGSIGYLAKAKSEFCVAIRSALIMGDVVHLFAGAGIVPGSKAINEWKELDKKVATLLSLIQSHLTIETQFNAMGKKVG